MSQFNSFGKAIRQLRHEQKLPLRTVAAYLDIDQAILSKIESGQRNAPRDIVSKLSSYFNTDDDVLVSLWLSDKILYVVEGEKMANDALQIAESRMRYQTAPLALKNIINQIQSVLRKDDRVLKAWIFGSFAREEQTLISDIDLMIRFHETKKISLFDLADISNKLEQSVGTKIDLVEEEGIVPEMIDEVNRHKILIYG